MAKFNSSILKASLREIAFNGVQGEKWIPSDFRFQSMQNPHCRWPVWPAAVLVALSCDASFMPSYKVDFVLSFAPDHPIKSNFAEPHLASLPSLVFLKKPGRLNCDLSLEPESVCFGLQCQTMFNV